MLNKINEIISTVNFIVCNVNNIQKYIGTKTETSTDSITGRLTALEAAAGINLLDENGKIKCEYINCECCLNSENTWGSEEWAGSEWPAEDSISNNNTEEW